MKSICMTAAISCFCLYGFSQDTVYFDRFFERVTSKADAEYYGFTEDNGHGHTHERIYQFDGKMYSSDYYSTYENKVRDGACQKYYPNGQLMEDVDYTNGRQDGITITYWPDGKKRSDERYEEGRRISGTCYGRSGEAVNCKDAEPTYVMPEYRGGEKALMDFLAKNVHYPSDAREYGYQGTVYVTFFIDRDGTVQRVSILRGVCKSIDEESLRIVKLMPAWIPGMIEGVPMVTEYRLPIRFSLN